MGYGVFSPRHPNYWITIHMRCECCQWMRQAAYCSELTFKPFPYPTTLVASPYSLNQAMPFVSHCPLFYISNASLYVLDSFDKIFSLELLHGISKYWYLSEYSCSHLLEVSLCRNWIMSYHAELFFILPTIPQVLCQFLILCRQMLNVWYCCFCIV